MSGAGDEVTDPAILSQLNAPDPAGAPAGGAPPPSDEVTDPAILAQLNGPAGTPAHGASGQWEAPQDKLPLMDQVHVAWSDNFEEKEAYFRNKYGASAVQREWGDDGRPALVVKTGDKTFRVGDAGFVAQLTADSPKLVGMIGGAITGAEAGTIAGPFGTLAGGIVGAGVGATAGKAGIEVAKAREGSYHKTPGQLGAVLGDAANEGYEQEMGGRLMHAGVASLLGGKLPRFLTGATDRSNETTGAAMDRGAMPPLQTALPDMKHMQRVEQLADLVNGNASGQIERNKAFVISTMKETLTKNGVPAAYVDRVTKDAADNPGVMSHALAGDELAQSVRAHVAAFNDGIKESGRVAQGHIDAQVEHLTSVVDKNSHGQLSTQFQTGVESAKKDVTDTARVLYDKIDSVTGGAEVVNVDQFGAIAKEIVDQQGPQISSALQRQAAELYKTPDITPENALLMQEFGISLPPSGKISIKEAQRWRTAMSERGNPKNLTHNTQEREYLRLADAMNDSIHDAASDPAVKPAIEALDYADNFWKTNIRKFGDMELKNMLGQIRTGAPPDPENIVNMISKVGKSARTTQLRQMLGDGTWSNVRSVHMNQFMRDVTAHTPDGDAYDGNKILGKLKTEQQENSFIAVHGEEALVDMRELGRMISAKEGKLDPAKLKDGGVKSALLDMRSQQSRMDQWMQSPGSLAALAKDGRGADQAYQWLARPGPKTEARLAQVVSTFGENSGQVQALRQAAVEEVVRSTTSRMIESGGSSELKKLLSSYTGTQRKILFPNGMDKDLDHIGDVIEDMFPKESGVKAKTSAPQLTAGAILNLPFVARAPIQVMIGLGRMIVTHPEFIKFLTVGREYDESTWIRATAQTLDKMSRGMVAESGSKLDNMREQRQGQPTQMPGPPTIQ